MEHAAWGGGRGIDMQAMEGDGSHAGRGALHGIMVGGKASSWAALFHILFYMFQCSLFYILRFVNMKPF